MTISTKQANRWFPVALGLAVLLVASPAEAYVGPGAGFAFVTSFFLLLGTVLLALLALLTWPIRMVVRLVARKRPPLPSRVKRVIVVGLDGIDPRTVRRLMNAGRLPNFQRLMAKGGFSTLGTSCPPLSPVAWSSFSTGVDPSRHGLFDFLTRDRRSYRAKLSSTDVRPARRRLSVGGMQIPLGRPSLRILQRSVPFWHLLGQYGVRSSVLRVPITFPPRGFTGTLLSAMCVPDLLGTQGTFSYYAEDAAETERIGGKVIQIKPGPNGQYATHVKGPTHPLRKDARPLTVPLIIERVEGKQQVQLTVGTKKVTAELHKHTDWVPVTFKIAPGMKLRGICRYRLMSLNPLRLYATPINIDPANPSTPLAHPFSFSVFLSKLIGSYATLGFAEDTWALNENVIDKDAFWEQVELCQQEREEMFFEMLRRTREGMCICVFDGTDRVQHMYMRDRDQPDSPYRHKIDDIYVEMDRMLSRLYQRVSPEDPQTLLLVMSDHGFAPFERGVHLNNWLMENGYLALKEGVKQPGEFLEGVDWSKTRAFALGLTGIYLNIKGRERWGIVSRSEATVLREELANKLTELVDHHEGREHKPMPKVFITSKIYAGPYQDDAPDLIIGYQSGYRASWETVRGMFGQAVVTDNPRHWSGDHCIDPDQVPGVILSNQPLALDGSDLTDLAPTILEAFGVRQPKHMRGRSLWNNAGSKGANVTRAA